MNAQGISGWPLDGVRVLAVEQMQSLPYATQLLARLGADVVKVEDPVRGESGRASRPAVVDEQGREVGATFLRNNLGKRSLTLDLQSEEGRNLFRRLVPRFDVVAENLKPGSAQRLGIAYADLVELHPGLVYLSVSGFGSLVPSPYQSWSAYAATVEAMSGLFDANRVGSERPMPGVAGPLGDVSAAIFAVIGVLAALRQRDRTGQGQHVDVAMFDATVATQDMVPFMWSMGEHRPPVQRRRLAGILDSFAAADGFFVLAVLRDHQFARLCRVIGREEWIDDERFRSRAEWGRHVDTVFRPAIESWAAARTKLEASAALCDAGLAAAPSNTPVDVLADPHLRARHMLWDVERPDAEKPFTVVGNPVKIAGLAERPPGSWPGLGEHTDAVLRDELGLDETAREALRRQGVV